MSNLFCIASSFFPALDPVSLSAPIPIFKALLLVTSSLHFVAVEMLVGGLMLAILLNGFAQTSSRYSQRGELLRTSANVFARRLPILMTYVINFAIPPLLFVQVIYGQAFYTSSVLIGIYWIAVIFILMIAYWLLYKFANRCGQGYSGLFYGVISWMCIGLIGKILSVNMTLMMTPEVWTEIYKNSPSGIFCPPSDACILARWIFMIVGAIVATGLWSLWLGSKQNRNTHVCTYLSAFGSRMIFWGIPVHILAGCWLWSLQSDVVKTNIQEPGLGALGIALWLFSYGILWLTTWNKTYITSSVQKRYIHCTMYLLGCISIFSIVLIRSSIRDITLYSKGFFDTTNLPNIQPNFFVFAIFLVLFLLGIIVIAWLAAITLRTKAVSEKIQIPTVPVAQKIVDTEQSESHACGAQISRRKFLTPTILALGTVYLGGISYSIYRYLERAVTEGKGDNTVFPSEILLKNAKKIPTGSAMEFAFQGHGALLIHHEDNSWTAYTSVCTHQGCKVQYEPEKDVIFCPCHAGVFNSKTGEPLSGPPKTTLPSYKVELVDNDIIVRS